MFLHFYFYVLFWIFNYEILEAYPSLYTFFLCVGQIAEESTEVDPKFRALVAIGSLVTSVNIPYSLVFAVKTFVITLNLMHIICTISPTDAGWWC